MPWYLEMSISRRTKKVSDTYAVSCNQRLALSDRPTGRVNCTQSAMAGFAQRMATWIIGCYRCLITLPADISGAAAPVLAAFCAIQSFAFCVLSSSPA